jgi:hypothetical protein
MSPNKHAKDLADTLRAMNVKAFVGLGENEVFVYSEQRITFGNRIAVGEEASKLFPGWKITFKTTGKIKLA